MANLNKIAAVISVVVGLSATIALWRDNRELSILTAIIIVLSSLWFVYSERDIGFRVIKRGLRRILLELHKKNFHPDTIIAFNRLGSVAAGMLSANYSEAELVVVNRTRLREKIGELEKNTYHIGSLVNLGNPGNDDKTILVVFFIVDSGQTLEKALQYLESQNITGRIHVASLYISPSARRTWPDITFAYEHANCKNLLNKLPWVIDEYQ